MLNRNIYLNVSVTLVFVILLIRCSDSDVQVGNMDARAQANNTLARLAQLSQGLGLLIKQVSVDRDGNVLLVRTIQNHTDETLEIAELGAMVSVSGDWAQVWRVDGESAVKEKLAIDSVVLKPNEVIASETTVLSDGINRRHLEYVIGQTIDGYPYKGVAEFSVGRPSK